MVPGDLDWDHRHTMVVTTIEAMVATGGGTMVVVLGLITATMGIAVIRNVVAMMDIVGILVGGTSTCSSEVPGLTLGHHML